MPSDLPRVLFVDDDQVILRLLEVNFRLEGFDVASASRGEEAVERAASSPPDAVVCDVIMPGIDGFEVCRRVRSIQGLGRLPFLFLTGRSLEDDRDRLVELEHAEMASKPFDAVELVATVRRMIAETAA